MPWRSGVPVCALVVLAGVACTSSSRTAAPTAAEAQAPTAKELWSHVTFASGPATGVGSAAAIDGFRVHPDPGDDGVIHVVSGGERVVVNASDIASRPPAAQSFLVVNWGDGPNQRVGCGPCRADHDYEPGRYTLVASVDGTDRDRSISVQVQVSAPREKKEPSRFPVVGFQPDTLAVGQTGYLILPFPPPLGISGLSIFISCNPFTIFTPIPGPPLFLPGGFGLPFTGNAPGTCTATYSGTDANGPFAESYVVTIQ